MKNILLLALFFVQYSGQCQDNSLTQYNKNILSIETGIYSRGLIGVTYNRLFSTKSQTFFGLSAGFGIGPRLTTINQFGTLNGSVYVGKNKLFFVIGVEVKYYNLTRDRWDLFGSYVVNEYVGITASPSNRNAIVWRRKFCV